jgi:MoaA/NifB/PqqE/SkfB family radical SAM enzyme
VIADQDRWFRALDRVWTDLRAFPLGLSLSGLEATADPAWFLRLMDLVDAHRPLFLEKVLYSNGSGFAWDDTGPRLVEALARTGFDRVELSRAHFDEQRNQQVMRFEKDQPVWRAAAFDDVVRRLQGAGVAVKLSCILNRQGVRTIDDVEAHLAHARELGVKRVVFRELSALGDLYVENRETRWIDDNRVAVRDLMEAALSSTGEARPGWQLVGVTAGYYYYNEVYRVADVDVILEASSYVAHHDVLQAGVLQKLVFHSTGDLCGDWVPNALVVGNWFDGP